MLKRLLCPALIFAALAAGNLAAQEPALPPAKTVQEQLQEWVKTKQLISREKSDWEAEKVTLTDLNDIRQREIENLGEFIEAAGQRIDEIAKQRSTFEEEETELKSWRKTLLQKIESLEIQIRPLLIRFPPPLRESVEEAILRVEKPDDEQPLQNRTRDLLLVMQAYLDFQNSLTVDGEVREIDGERREVDVLYLGLTQAWFVDATGAYGGHGTPSDAGWTWVEDHSLASRIRKAIDIQKRQAPPEFLSLPILNGNPSAK